MKQLVENMKKKMKKDIINIKINNQKVNTE